MKVFIGVAAALAGLSALEHPVTLTGWLGTSAHISHAVISAAGTVWLWRGAFGMFK